MLLYTGQRISAILNLRIKDINVEEGTFYLNEERGDLKGASGKRPLLYAEKAAREWLRSHPCKNDPEAFFITHKAPNRGREDYEVGGRLDDSTIYVVLQNIKERAGVSKPCNPHNFRHSFVTIAVRDYGMDFDTVKWMIGHRPDSQVMEKTYKHLTDDDYIQEAKEATGIKEKEEESPLTPDICDNCGEPVPIENAKACASCGIAFTPDAYQTQEQVDESMYQAKGELDGEEESALDRMKDEVVDEVKAELLEELQENQ
jgi:hypothetical protein